MALADVAEPRSVDPLDSGDICPGGFYGAPGAGHQVQQDQVTPCLDGLRRVVGPR